MYIKNKQKGLIKKNSRCQSTQTILLFVFLASGPENMYNYGFDHKFTSTGFSRSAQSDEIFSFYERHLRLLLFHFCPSSCFIFAQRVDILNENTKPLRRRRSVLDVFFYLKKSRSSLPYVNVLYVERSTSFFDTLHSCTLRE